MKKKRFAGTNSHPKPKAPKKSKKQHTDAEPKPEESTKESTELDPEAEGKQAVEDFIKELDRKQEAERLEFLEKQKQRELEEEEEDKEEKEEHEVVEEKVLTLEDYLNHYGSPLVIDNLCVLLKEYKTNPPGVNQTVVDLLDKISRLTDYEPMMYQVHASPSVTNFFQMSVLLLFNQILHDREIKSKSDFQSMLSFVTRIVANFLDCLHRNEMMVVFSFMWKKKTECLMIKQPDENGKISVLSGFVAKQDPSKKSKITWTQEEVKQLTTLYNQ